MGSNDNTSLIINDSQLSILLKYNRFPKLFWYSNEYISKDVN